jgi:8-oxo-dGTP pyrophosphatase MutT (NUDIX family)
MSEKKRESAGIAIICKDEIFLTHPTNARWYGTYSIPKGGVEPGEAIPAAAQREFEEETGLTIKLVAADDPYFSINTTYGHLHVYIKVIENYSDLGLSSNKVEKDKLQLAEIDWAGFVKFKEAEDRITAYQSAIIHLAQNYIKMKQSIVTLQYWAMPGDKYGFTLKEEGHAHIFVKENNLSKTDLKYKLAEAGVPDRFYNLILTGQGATEKIGKTQYGELKITDKPHEMSTPTTAATTLEQKQVVSESEATVSETTEQSNKPLPYIPESKICTELNTVVPQSMRFEMKKAFMEIGRKVRDVDHYVATKLGYVMEKCSSEQLKEGMQCLCSAFAAEQVDALAVAIYNIEEKGLGTIIADETGIGKGRVAAGLIRYAVRHGYPAIFLTEKPNLFSDIFRDIIDIGSDCNVPLFRKVGTKEVRKRRSKMEIEAILKEAEANGEDLDEVRAQIEVEDENNMVVEEQYERNKEYDAMVKHALKKTGIGQLKPFIVNGSGKKTDIKNPEGHILYKGYPQQETSSFINKKELPAGCKFIMATYSQFRSSKTGAKMEFLRQMANNAIVIMDESHNASGDSNTGHFLNEVLRDTKGVCFLSATFAKRPDNMPIYAAKTSVKEAAMTNEDLIAAITKGGVALQEVLSSQIVQQGELVRRQRSSEGLTVNYIVLDKGQEDEGCPQFNLEEIHRANADAITDIVRDIMDFQQNYVNPEVDKLDEVMKGELAEVEGRKGAENVGVDNPPVFNGIFNLVSQMLFSIKAEAVAEKAIIRLKENRKVVIAFANTMESFLDNMTDDEGNLIKTGDTINTNFTVVLERRLQSVFKTTTKHPDGNTTYGFIDIKTLNYEAQAAYGAIVAKIKKASVGISISPIDVIVNKIEAAGYKIGEVTGRKKCIKFNGDNYSSGTVKARQVKTVDTLFREFNDNELDVLLINQSGATGASAHAKPTKKVPAYMVKRRCMIVLQPELDINKEVQKRGRINRSGQLRWQVKEDNITELTNKQGEKMSMLPEYDYVTSAIPAEKRLMMMLAKKLKSLDANTTSNQKQSRSILDFPDFLNKYGDKVVLDYCKENKEFNKRIGDPLKLNDTSGKGEDEGSDSANQVPDKAHKVSGRVAILSTAEQEKFYSEIIDRYISRVEYLKETGAYDLEVDNYNLEAETIERRVLIFGSGGDSLFGRNSILEKCEVNNLRKPFYKDQLMMLMEQGLNGFPNGKTQAAELLKKLKTFTDAKIQQAEIDVQARWDKALKNITNEKPYLRLKSDRERRDYEHERTQQIENSRIVDGQVQEDAIKNKNRIVADYITAFYTGLPVLYPTADYNQSKATIKGVVIGIQMNEKANNPFAPYAVKVKIALANSKRMVAIPLSETGTLNTIIAESMGMAEYERREIIDDWNDHIKSSTSDRTIRYIVTGNLLKAYENEAVLNGGKLISFTSKKGAIRKGIIMPEEFSTNDLIKGGSVRVTVPLDKCIKLIKGLKYGDKAIVSNQNLAIERTYDDDYKIIIPKSKKDGGVYFTDTTLLSMIEGRAGFQKGYRFPFPALAKSKTENHGNYIPPVDAMEGIISAKKIDELIKYLKDKYAMSVDLATGVIDKISDQLDTTSDYDVIDDQETDADHEVIRILNAADQRFEDENNAANLTPQPEVIELLTQDEVDKRVREQLRVEDVKNKFNTLLYLLTKPKPGGGGKKKKYKFGGPVNKDYGTWVVVDQSGKKALNDEFHSQGEAQQAIVDTICGAQDKGTKVKYYNSLSVARGEKFYAPKGKYLLVCTSAGNPDFQQAPELSISPEEVYIVSSPIEASEKARAYIAEYELGGGNWTGGHVFNDAGEIVARVSYNGRVWEPGQGGEFTGKKLKKFSRGGRIDKAVEEVEDLFENDLIEQAWFKEIAGADPVTEYEIDSEEGASGDGDVEIRIEIPVTREVMDKLKADYNAFAKPFEEWASKQNVFGANILSYEENPEHLSITFEVSAWSKYEHGGQVNGVSSLSELKEKLAADGYNVTIPGGADYVAVMGMGKGYFQAKAAKAKSILEELKGMGYNAISKKDSDGYFDFYVYMPVEETASALDADVLATVVYALNAIPNQRRVGPNGESSYDIASEISKAKGNISPTLLHKIKYAFNMIPNKQKVGKNGESSYEIASKLSKFGKGGQPASARARERKYTSNQDWEQRYSEHRVTPVKHYKTSYGDGGQPASARARERKYTSHQPWEQLYRKHRSTKIRYYKKTYANGGKIVSEIDKKAYGNILAWLIVTVYGNQSNIDRFLKTYEADGLGGFVGQLEVLIQYALRWYEEKGGDFNAFIEGADAYVEEILANDTGYYFYATLSPELQICAETIAMFTFCVFEGPETAQAFQEAYPPQDTNGLPGQMKIIVGWANQFDEKNEGREWDGEFFEEVEAEVSAKLSDYMPSGASEPVRSEKPAYNPNYDKESVKNVILNEGIIYAIESYMDEDAISSDEPKLKELWKDASGKISDIVQTATSHDYDPGYLIHNEDGYAIINDPDGDYEEIPVSKLPKDLKDKIKALDKVLAAIMKYVGLDKKQQGDKFAKGGRTKAAINKDRKYKSHQPWELLYHRVHRPAYYNNNKFADGGLAPLDYDGMNPGKVWATWNKDQRVHFLEDHLREYLSPVSRDSEAGIEDFSKLDKRVQNSIGRHVYSTRYSSGGVTTEGLVPVGTEMSSKNLEKRVVWVYEQTPGNKMVQKEGVIKTMTFDTTGKDPSFYTVLFDNGRELNFVDNKNPLASKINAMDISELFFKE